MFCCRASDASSPPRPPLHKGGGRHPRGEGKRGDRCQLCSLGGFAGSDCIWFMLPSLVTQIAFFGVNNKEQNPTLRTPVRFPGLCVATSWRERFYLNALLIPGALPWAVLSGPFQGLRSPFPDSLRTAS